VLAISTVLAMSGTAQALTRSQSFNVSWTFKSKKLGVCVTFSVSGKISYTAVQGPHSVLWKDQELKSPTLTTKVHAYNKGRCTGSAKLRKISMGQFWTGYSCSFNPSLSASAPWGVSIGGWPSCGNRKRAGFTSNPDGPSAVFHQYNTGARVSFANHTGATKANDPCYGVFVSATAYRGSDSESFGINSGSKSRKVCLPA
jgi:hypothetical protein